MEAYYREVGTIDEEVGQHVVEFIYFWAKYQTDFEHEVKRSLFLENNSFMASLFTQL